jgi:hypothetical protein
MKRNKQLEEDILATAMALNILARRLVDAGVDVWLREQDEDILADEIEFMAGKPEQVEAMKAKKAAK